MKRYPASYRGFGWIKKIMGRWHERIAQGLYRPIEIVESVELVQGHLRMAKHLELTELEESIVSEGIKC